MRVDLNVFWVEDTPTWRIATEKLIKLELDELGLSVKFDEIKSGDHALSIINKNAVGFKKYDLFLIDFNLSSKDDVDGQRIIEVLRGDDVDVDADILFYSQKKEKQIREKIKEDVINFEGIYVCNRNDFVEKVIWLLKKNARRQLSIKNIRGMLMDNTSENDFIVKSYILQKYGKLKPEDRKSINDKVCEYFKNSTHLAQESMVSNVNSLKTNGIEKINEFLQLNSFYVSLELKYLIFKWMIEISGNSEDIVVLENYNKNVVKHRNTLAHKKLEVCEQQSHIKYCDDYKQYLNRACNGGCGNCAGDNKISLQEWESIRKMVLSSSNIFDKILDSIKEN